MTANWITRSLRTLLVLLCLALPLAPLLAVSVARAANTGPAADPVHDAQVLYDESKFDAAITGLKSAIATGQVTGSQAIAARALMGRCLVKAGKRLEAKESFKSILREDPGFRLDSAVAPPDEMDVFTLAAKEVTAEQIEIGRRVPASLGFFFGSGSSDNTDLGKIVKQGGGADKFDATSEFGGSVRFPIRPRWSLDVELARFRATDHDSASGGGQIQYEATALPLVLSLYYTVLPRERYRLNLFAGAGPMLASRASIDFPFFSIRLLLADERVGTYLQGGLEGEYLLNSRFSLSGRVDGRYANAGKLFDGSTLNLYSDPNSKLADRKVDFSGVGAFVALRAYIGY